MNKKIIVEVDNNANITVRSDKSTYCLKCGNKLDDDSLDDFCDSECRKEYYAEIRHDLRGIKIGRNN